MDSALSGLCLLADTAAILAKRTFFLGFPSPFELRFERENIDRGVKKRKRTSRAIKVSFKKAVEDAQSHSMIGIKRKPEMDLERFHTEDGSASSMPYCPKLQRSTAACFPSPHPSKIHNSDSHSEIIILPRSISKPDELYYTELPPAISSTIHLLCGSEPKLIIQKRLTRSDMGKNLGRLLLPLGQILREDFLYLEEGKMLEDGGNITVSVIEPCLHITTLCLRKWKMSSGVFALNAGWNKTAHNPQNMLSENDVIQVWSFRAQGKLGFAIVKVPNESATGCTWPSSPSSTVTTS